MSVWRLRQNLCRCQPARQGCALVAHRLRGQRRQRYESAMRPVFSRFHHRAYRARQKGVRDYQGRTERGLGSTRRQAPQSGPRGPWCHSITRDTRPSSVIRAGSALFGAGIHPGVAGRRGPGPGSRAKLCPSHSNGLKALCSVAAWPQRSTAETGARSGWTRRARPARPAIAARPPAGVPVCAGRRRPPWSRDWRSPRR
jgi:hypothetical protein